MHHSSTNRKMPRLLLLLVLLPPLVSTAQYRGDHIPGFIGLDAGTQAPPGIYVGNLVWIYPVSTIKGDNGNAVNIPGRLTSVAEMVLLNWTTNYKLFGANVGGSVGIPFIKNRLQLNSLDVSTDWGFSDTFITPVNLGWNLKRADFIAAYNLYLPTGTFSPNSTNNTGLGMWGNEISVGSTVHLDQKKSWSAAAMFSLEFHTKKGGTNISVGDLGTVEGGLGKTFYKKVGGPVPMITNVGVVGYSQFKVTGDNGSDIPAPLQGLRDRVFALGPEANIFIPKPRLTLLFRYLPEFGALNRTQGQTFVISIAWVAKSLVKQKQP